MNNVSFINSLCNMVFPNSEIDDMIEIKSTQNNMDNYLVNLKTSDAIVLSLDKTSRNIKLFESLKYFSPEDTLELSKTEYKPGIFSDKVRLIINNSTYKKIDVISDHIKQKNMIESVRNVVKNFSIEKSITKMFLFHSSINFKDCYCLLVVSDIHQFFMIFLDDNMMLENFYYCKSLVTLKTKEDYENKIEVLSRMLSSSQTKVNI